MNRQNLINRLVDRKLQTAGNAKPICVCMASPKMGVASKAASGAAQQQK